MPNADSSASGMLTKRRQRQQQQQQLEGIQRQKRHDSTENTPQWKDTLTAHRGLQDAAHHRLLRQPEQAQVAVTNDQLEQAAPSQAIGERWVQLNNNLHYGSASTVCRQRLQNNGLDTRRQQRLRYSIPLSTRSVGYLTRLLKPQLDERTFEESFTTWEFQLAKTFNHRMLLFATTTSTTAGWRHHHTRTHRAPGRKVKELKTKPNSGPNAPQEKRKIQKKERKKSKGSKMLQPIVKR